jgi:hypothetical protein
MDFCFMNCKEEPASIEIDPALVKDVHILRAYFQNEGAVWFLHAHVPSKAVLHNIIF